MTDDHERGAEGTGPEATFVVYLIRCRTPRHYYVGRTLDYENRIRRHQERISNPDKVRRRQRIRFVDEHGFVWSKVLEAGIPREKGKAKETEWTDRIRIQHPDWTVRGALSPPESKAEPER